MRSDSAWPAVVMVVSGYLITAGVQSSRGDGVREKCPELEQSLCTCFQLQALRCNVTSLTGLNLITEAFSTHGQIYSGVRLLDLALANIPALPAPFLHSMPLSGLAISSKGQLIQLDQDSLPVSLSTLNLCQNGFESVPPAVCTLRELKSLDLSENRLKQIGPDSAIRLCDALQDLSLAQNQLETISLTVPSSLRSLILKSNQLDFNGLKQLRFPFIKSLDLSENSLSGPLESGSLAGEGGPPYQLVRLDVSFNRLTSIGADAFRNVAKLKQLYLSSNLLESIHHSAFVSLNDLMLLDLSNNSLTQVSAASLAPLHQLVQLGLASNQLLQADFLQDSDFPRLTTINLQQNNISLIHQGFTLACSTCKAVNFDSNPFDCLCQLSDFQTWLQTHRGLSRTSRQSARCSSPGKYNGALVSEVALLTCNDEVQLPYVSLISHYTNESDSKLQMSWSVRLNSFQCQSIQVFVNQGLDEVYSRPLDCARMHDQPHGVDQVNVVLDLRKIPSDMLQNGSLLVCLVLLDKSAGQASPVSGCGNVTLDPPSAFVGNNNNNSNSSSSSSSSTDGASLTLLSAKINWTLDLLSVFFELQVPRGLREACELTLQVRDLTEDADHGEDVVSQQIIGCNVQKFHFRQLSLRKEHHLYQVCGQLHLAVPQQAVQPEAAVQCIRVQDGLQPPDSGGEAEMRRSKPILPLALTLVFLAIGIAVLILLYVIVRGYLSGRQKTLFCHLASSLIHRRSWLPAGQKHLFGDSRRRRRFRLQRSDQCAVGREMEDLSVQDNVTVTSLITD